MSKFDFRSGHRGFLVIAAGGIVFLIIAMVFFISTKHKLDSWTRIEAKVVKWERYEKKDSDGDWVVMYSEIVEYEADGKIYTATNTASSNIRPTIGTTRTIAYDPESPETCIFVSDNYLLCIILFVLGGIITVSGISFFLRSSYVKSVPAPVEEVQDDNDEFKFGSY